VVARLVQQKHVAGHQRKGRERRPRLLSAAQHADLGQSHAVLQPEGSDRLREARGQKEHREGFLKACEVVQESEGASMLQWIEQEG
jgi:hypothetical protein